MEHPGTTACPHKGCDGEVDVPPGTHDGEALECWACRRECHLVVGRDGSWWLDAGEED